MDIAGPDSSLIDDLPLALQDAIADMPADELLAQTLAPSRADSTAAPEPEASHDVWSMNEDTIAPEEPRAGISDEVVVRFVELLQSHGPAWFKMWVLELKESPQRLPDILSEVTGDPVLLNQADNPAYQSALLSALIAEPPLAGASSDPAG